MREQPVPLRRPVCHSPTRVIALIDDPRVVEKILRHLGAWLDPLAGLSTAGTAGPYTCSRVRGSNGDQEVGNYLDLAFGAPPEPWMLRR